MAKTLKKKRKYPLLGLDDPLKVMSQSKGMLRFERHSKLWSRKLVKQSHPRLRKAISMVKKDTLIRDFPAAFRIIIWELMKTQTRLYKLENKR